MSVRSPVLPSSFQMPCPHTHEHESSLGTLTPDEAGSEEAVCALEVCHSVWPSLPPSKATFTPPLRQKMDEGLFFSLPPLMSTHSEIKAILQHAFDTHLSDVE